MVDAEYFKERKIWIDRYRALERQVTDPLAALLVHDIVSELETRDGEPHPGPAAAPDSDAPPTHDEISEAGAARERVTTRLVERDVNNTGSHHT
jgi:hypothetical protein